MELIKYGHACVVLEQDGRRLVIDPGMLTPEDALAGADGVLVTHEHADHFAPEKLAARPDLLLLDEPTNYLDVETTGSVVPAATRPGSTSSARATRSPPPGSRSGRTGSGTPPCTRTSRGSVTSASWSAAPCSTRVTP